MYTLHSNPPSPLWKQLGDSNRLAPQSGDGHVTCTSQLPISPVRVERYLKPKQAMMVTAASPRMERKVAASGAKASPGQPADTALLAEKSASLHFGQLGHGGHAFAPVPQTEISTQPLSVDLSSQGQNISLSAASNTQLCTTNRKVARLLTFSDSSLRDVDDATLPQAKDSPHVLYSADSLELSDISSTASTEMNRSSVVSPRFYDGLPISLEELLSSSSDASASTSPQLGKEGAASAPAFSFTSPVSQWQKDDSKANPRPPLQLAAIPLSPHGADTIIRPRSSPVPSRRGDHISSQESHSTLSINSLQATGGVRGGRGEMDEQTDITFIHRPRLLQPRLSAPRVAMATNTRVQPVAMPPSDTTQMLPNVFSSRGPDTKTLRAINFRRFHLLKRVLSLWRAGVGVRRDQADLLHQRALLRRGIKAFKHNYRVAMETNKMAVWRLQQEKTRRLFHKWKVATKLRQLAIVRHFFLLWRRMRQLRATELTLTEAKNHALLSARFLQWRGRFRFSLMEISASQFWRGRIVQECFTEWRIRTAQQQACAYAEEVVTVTHQSTMKRQAFQEWRMASNVRRQQNVVLQMELLRKAFTHWKTLAANLGENKLGSVQSATDLRHHALLRKGFRKWLLKYREQCFEKKRAMRLFARMFVVWYQRVGQRGKDMLSATAFNQQILIRGCWAEMKRRCAAKYRREKLAVLLRQRVLLRRCFLGWRRYMYQATLQCVCEEFVEQKRCRQLQAYFDHWVLSICQRQHEGTLSVCASQASERAALRKAFTAWAVIGRCAGTEKRVQGWIARHMMQRCFNRWCTALKRCRALRQLVTAKTRSLKESAFHQWRERVCRNEAERTALIHQRLCVLKRSFAVWKGEHLKVHLSLTHGAVCLESLTSRCLHVWREKAALRRRLGATLEQMLKEWELKRKREVLALWRGKASKVKAVRLLSGLLTENLLRKCLQAWHSHTACSMSELETSFLTHLHQAILVESNCSVSTPAITPSCTALPSNQPCIVSAANDASLAPSVDNVKRNLFQDTSLPSLSLAASNHAMTSLQSFSSPMEEIAQGHMSTPHHHLSADTSADSRVIGASLDSMAVATLLSPASKLRILEESPSPIAEGSAKGPPLLLTPGRVLESTARHEMVGVSALNGSGSLTPDSLEEETSFLSVNLCQCVSDDVRTQLQELDSALTLNSSCLEVSDDGSLEGVRLMWMEQELEPAAPVGQPTEANAMDLSTVPGVLQGPGVCVAPLSPSSMAHNLPKDSAVVSRLLHILQCWRLYPCGKVFHQWRCYTAWRKRIKKVYDTTSKHHQASVLRVSLGAWRRRVQMCTTLVDRCETLTVSFAQRQLYVEFIYWRRHTQSLLERSSAMGQVAEAHRGCALMRQSFCRWSEEVVRCKYDKATPHKLNLWRTRAAFTAWRRSAAVQNVKVKQATQSADVFSRRNVLSRVFARWRQRLLALKKTTEAITGQLQGQHSMMLLSQSYRQWQQRCALNHKRDLSARDFHMGHVLRQSMSTWRRRCIARMNREKEMIVAADRFTAKSALQMWKRCLHARVRASVLADQHHAKVVLRASFNHWRKEASSSLSRGRTRATTAEEFHQRSTKSRYLRQWREYLILQEARRQEQCRLLLKRQRGSRLHRSFRTWTHQLLLAQQMYKLRAARRQGIIVRCWGRWKDLALASHAANKQHSTAVLLRSWRRWRISFIEQRTANEVVVAANRRRLRRILKAWIAVTAPAHSPAPRLLCKDSTASLNSVPPLLGVFAQSPSRELVRHVFNLWKHRARLCTEARTL